MVAAAKVEVTARGEKFIYEKDHAHGRVGTKYAMTQDELVAKFRHNAIRVLTREKIDRVVKSFLELEEVKSIEEIIREVTI